MDTAHIRIGVRPRGRRINDRGAAGRTLCGAPITAYDDEFRSAARHVAADCAVWPLCPECRAEYLRLTAVASTRCNGASA